MKSKRYILGMLLLAFALTLSVSLVHAQDDNVIKIASQSPLSGDQSNAGTSMRNAVELALEQLSGPLKDMGFDIQYVPFDDQATPEVGVANAQNIVADQDILALVGHWNSGVAIPSSEVYAANNLVMVSPANTNPGVTSRGLGVVNRVCGRDDNQGPTGAKFLADLGTVKSVYIIHDKSTYGQGVATYFKGEAERDGLTVLGFDGTEEKANFEGVFQPILAQSPDAIFMGGYYPGFGIFINQIRAAGYTGILMGADGLDNADFAKVAGDAGVGTYYTSAAGPASLYPAAAQFIADYTAKFGAAPQPYGPESYDAAHVVLNAIQVAAMLNGGAKPTRAQIAAAVRGTHMTGLTGDISFDPYGDRSTATYYVLQVTSSDPTKWSENKVLSTVQLSSPYNVLIQSMMGS